MDVVYEAGTRDPSEIGEFVLSVLDELRDGGEALQQARDSGFDVEALAAEPVGPDEITIKASKSGIDPLSTVIVITIGRPIALDLWRKFCCRR